MPQPAFPITDVQLDIIREFLQDELLKRGFTAPITEIGIKPSRSGAPYLVFSTEDFQTTPVLFKSIRVNNFSSGMTLQTTEGDNPVRYYSSWTQVHVSYKHFDGGGNGSNLFSLGCDISEDGKSVWGLKVGV